jgi:ATP synthase assembly factor FMC1
MCVLLFTAASSALYTSTMTTAPPTHLRSLYRRLLRELPARQPSLLTNPSPIQHTIRQHFISPSAASATSSISTSAPSPAVSPVDPQAAEQFLQYLKAQRTYTTLIERYNPGMTMTDEDRVRMTARRVGMDLPEELRPGGGSGRD